MSRPKDQPLPEEHRLAISRAMKGVPKEETHREKMSEGMKESWKRRRKKWKS